MSQPNEPVTLAEYVAAHTPQSRCLLCTVPADIEEQACNGKSAGVTYRLLAEWLEQAGYPGGTKGRLERHFQFGHVHPSRQENK
jgi:hypothetical protein